MAASVSVVKPVVQRPVGAHRARWGYRGLTTTLASNFASHGAQVPTKRQEKLSRPAAAPTLAREVCPVLVFHTSAFWVLKGRSSLLCMQ